MGLPSIDALMAYEEGELDEGQTLDLFAGLIQSGLAWRLQGVYGRTADAFIRANLISRDGVVL